MNNNEADLGLFLVELLFEIFSVYNEFPKDNELEKGNFDLLCNENYGKEKDIFEGYKDFKLDNTNADIYTTTKLEK